MSRSYSVRKRSLLDACVFSPSFYDGNSSQQPSNLALRLLPQQDQTNICKAIPASVFWNWNASSYNARHRKEVQQAFLQAVLCPASAPAIALLCCSSQGQNDPLNPKLMSLRMTSSRQGEHMHFKIRQLRTPHLQARQVLLLP